MTYLLDDTEQRHHIMYPSHAPPRPRGRQGYAMACHGMPCNAIQIQRNACLSLVRQSMSRHVLEKHVMPCHAMSCRGMPWRTRACHGMACHGIQWCAMPLHDMGWPYMHAMPCHGRHWTTMVGNEGRCTSTTDKWNHS